MRDYTKSISDLSSVAKIKIFKGINTYLGSYERKQIFKHSYHRHLQYFETGKHLPFSKDDFLSSFRSVSKDNFKDLDDCGSYLKFHWYQKSDVTKLHTGNFCKRDKLCPACAVRRAHKQQKKFLQIVQEDKSLLADKDWYYIVIPVRHSKEDRFEDVFSLIDQMKKKISMQMRDGRRCKSTGFFSRFSGGMFAIEITYKNGWNVHLNLLLNAPRIEHTESAVTRDGVSGDLGGLKKHTQIYEGKKKTTYSSPELSEWLHQFNGSYINSVSPLSFSDTNDIKSHLVEILKYSLKFASLTSQQLIEVFIKTRKKRLFGTFGNLWGRGLENVELEGDEIVDVEFVELIFTRSFTVDGCQTDFPTYKLYKREVKKVETPEEKELVHTFGVVIPKIAEHKKYYRSAPLIMISTGRGAAKFNIRKKE